MNEVRGVLPAGWRLGGYEIVTVLGQGGFGITYLARDTRLNRDVAIKEYLPTALALREEGQTVVPRSTELGQQFDWGRDRFLEEARTLARFERVPAIVRVHEFLEANKTAYMVMALAEGETLEQHLRHAGPLGPVAVETLLEPLLLGLEEVHAAGFLHRDIKPANVILDAHGKPTLIDFGASRAAMAGRTAAMTAIFTPGYAAPEQFTSEKQGPWTDIYGLSATLYNAITGKTPPSAFDRMIEDGYEPLATLKPRGFPAALLMGIDAGLAVRASDRPASIAAWREMLSGDSGATMVVPHGVVPHVVAPRATPAPARPSAPVASSRLPLYGGIAAIAVLLFAVVGYFALAPKNAATVPPAASEQVLLAETKLTLPMVAGGAGCGVNAWWIVQASSQKFEVKTAGNWIVFAADASANFGGTFHAGNGSNYTLSGNLKMRTVKFQNDNGCTFSGLF
jgi:serine/threonine protein kinase